MFKTKEYRRKSGGRGVVDYLMCSFPNKIIGSLSKKGPNNWLIGSIIGSKPGAFT